MVCQESGNYRPEPNLSETSGVRRLARWGLWLVPVYGALLALATITHQPDYDTDFRGYAEYVTTDWFLVSHLGASIAGAALGILGVVAALAFAVRGPAATAAVLGTACLIVRQRFSHLGLRCRSLRAARDRPRLPGAHLRRA
jgi:hypothetical protein